MGTRAEQLQDLAGSALIAISVDMPTNLPDPSSRNETAPKNPEAGRSAEGIPAGARSTQPPGEIGGPSGPEPTRYGDWEQKGRCSDF